MEKSEHEVRLMRADFLNSRFDSILLLDAFSGIQIDDSEAVSLCCRTMPHYFVDQATVWSKRNTGAGGWDVPTIPYKCGINDVSFDDISGFICTILMMFKII